MQKRLRIHSTARLPLRWARRPAWIYFSLLGIVLILGIGVALSVVVARQTGDLLNQSDQSRSDVMRNAFQYQADSLTKLWTGIVQAIAAIVLAIGGYFTWRNLRMTQQTLKATQDKLEVDRETQITNRFAQAIQQLGAVMQNGDPNLEVRLGGIYALERVARDSPGDHWTIMEILTAYVRQNARLASAVDDTAASPLPGNPKQPSGALRTDIQACLTVIGRRTLSDEREEGRLDLHGSDLHRAELFNAYLKRADLRGACLVGANLTDADLSEADLTDADVTEASFWHTKLRRASLIRAQATRARFGGAQLEDSALDSTHLESAFIEQQQVYCAD